MASTVEEFQRRITALLLHALDGAGFVLAGAGAIRAHGLTDRPTDDIDLFTRPLSAESFRAAVQQAHATLRAAGHDVDLVRESDTFARLRDFLDLDAIRGSGRYSDEDLLVLGQEDDPGFVPAVFAAQLSRITHFDAEEAAEYGVGTALSRR